MGLGESANSVIVYGDIDTAFRIAESAASEIGKIKESQPALGRIVVKSRFGLQAVKVRIQVNPGEGLSTIQLHGFSDDVWGGGARKVMDRLIQQINQLAPAPQIVEQDRECPYCAEIIKARAIVCKHCGRDIT